MIVWIMIVTMVAMWMVMLVLLKMLLMMIQCYVSSDRKYVWFISDSNSSASFFFFFSSSLSSAFCALLTHLQTVTGLLNDVETFYFLLEEENSKKYKLDM